ncbi:MAG TPA: ArsI/CadI family heavy metal resistance metalloenzyme [Arenimonas sp.]|nr:ArsI/CadI family heavy metal resistance metalloenzyme [Arenimonas sp.]
MNRFHVHLNVSDLDTSIRFYSQLFACEPAVVKPDYAKWMLADPSVNFAISTSGRQPGIDHLGLQTDSDEGLREIGRRLDAAGSSVVPEAGVVCCYAQSDKLWTEDPQGIRWETFHTLKDATTYHSPGPACASGGSSCSPGAETSETGRKATAAGCCGAQTGCC